MPHTPPVPHDRRGYFLLRNHPIAAYLPKANIAVSGSRAGVGLSQPRRRLISSRYASESKPV